MSKANRRIPQIGLIGVSGYATIYIDWFLEAQREGRVSIVAFVALKEEQENETAKQLAAIGAKMYGSYLEMLEKQKGLIDLCLIPTGIQWHARMTIEALKSGCNVLVEKPIAGSTSDALAIMEAAKQAGLWVAVGFQDLYAEEVDYLKRLIIGKRIGKIQFVSMLGIWPRSRSYYQRNHWAGKLKADGAFVLDSPLNNAFAHFVNLALFLAGESQYESCEVFLNNVQLYRTHDIESFDTAVIQASSQFGAEFWFGVSHASNITIDPVIRIKGSAGSVEWIHERECSIRTSLSAPELWKLSNSESVRKRMFNSVIARLSDPSVRICTPEIALCHTRLIESIHRIGRINDIDPSLVEEVSLNGSHLTIPSVIGIDSRLKEAFENCKGLTLSSSENASSKYFQP